MKLFYGWVVSEPAACWDAWRSAQCFRWRCSCSRWRTRRLVAHRRVERHDDRVPDDGASHPSAGALLTDRFGPLPVVLSGGVPAGAWPGARQPRHQPARVPVIYGCSSAAHRCGVRADDDDGDRRFEKRRSLAVSLVSAGMGMAPMTISPFASWLITNYDWRTAQLVIAIMAWVILVPTAFLVRRAPPAIDERERAPVVPGVTMGAADPDMDGGPGAALAAVLVLSLTTSAAAPRIPGRSSTP